MFLILQSSFRFFLLLAALRLLYNLGIWNLHLSFFFLAPSHLSMRRGRKKRVFVFIFIFFLKGGESFMVTVKTVWVSYPGALVHLLLHFSDGEDLEVVLSSRATPGYQRIVLAHRILTAVIEPSNHELFPALPSPS